MKIYVIKSELSEYHNMIKAISLDLDSAHEKVMALNKSYGDHYYCEEWDIDDGEVLEL